MALIVLITGADGVQYRLGPDEPDPAWVPENITWGSQIPGGWKEASFNLRRRIDEDIPLRLLDEVEIIDEHAQTVYEGRIQKLPRQHGDDYLFGVECLGWAAHLLDDKSFREIYVDRDLSQWRSNSLERQLDLSAASYKFTDVAVLPDDAGFPALKQVLQGPWASAAICESMYSVQIDIGSIYAAWQQVNANFANFEWGVAAYSSELLDAGSLISSTGDLQAAGPSSVILTVTGAGARMGRIWLLHQAANTNGEESAIYWTQVAVYGRHGLTKQGVSEFASGDPAAGGFYIDDMLADALARAAPKLNFTTGEGGSIEHPPLVVGQAAYPEPGPIENVLLDLNKYVLWDWGCEKGKTFFYRPTDPDRLCWEARLDRGIHLGLEGDDAEHAYNGAIVKYSLPDGARRVAGPPGSGFNVISDLLVDTDPENTVNAHGYPRRWIELDISFPLALDIYGTTIGAAYLAQASLPARSGDITLVGEIEHPTKGMRPVREVFAGDYIRLSDHPADVPRRIISTSHTNDGRSTTVTVGNDMNKVDALLEQLGVVTKVRLG